jgi:hypothetical protein
VSKDVSCGILLIERLRQCDMLWSAKTLVP